MGSLSKSPPNKPTIRVKNFRRYQHLTIIGLILITIIVLGSSLAFASSFRNSKVGEEEPKVVADVQVEENPSGPNLSIWSDEPVLKNMSGQNYHGRVAVEVWEDDGNIFYSSDTEGQNIPLLEQALSGLQDVSDTTVYTASPWTNEPVMGEKPAQIFQGRVVIEVWDNLAVVAIQGSASRLSLVHQAIQQLKELMEEETGR